MATPTFDLDAAPTTRVRPGMILLAGGGGLIVLFALLFTGAWVASHRRLTAELAKIRAAGEPASAEEIEAFYHLASAKQDTTQLWLSATARLDTPEFRADAMSLPFVGEGSDAIPVPDEPWLQLDEAEKFLMRYQTALDEMHQAARAGGRARFPTRFSEGITMLIPHVDRLRTAARVLALESAVYLHRGRPSEAAESVLAMFAAGRSLEQEPILVSQIVRMAIDGMARSRSAWLLSAGALDDHQLARFDAELAASDYQASAHHGLIGERCLGIQAFANPATLEPAAAQLAKIAALTRASDETLYLQVMAQMIDSAGNSGPTRTQAVARIDAELKYLAGQTGAKLRFPITLLMVPALTSFSETVNRNEAHRDATRAAVAIERFRLGQGRLPMTLDELMPEYLEPLPTDPYNSASLRYLLNSGEYVVYSVGSNLVDDGGSSEPANQPADVVVRVKLAKLLAITDQYQD